MHFKLGLLPRLERPVAPNSSPQLYLWLSGELFHSLFSLFSVGYAAELPERDGEEERKNCHFYACDHSTSTTRSSSADEAILKKENPNPAYAE